MQRQPDIFRLFRELVDWRKLSGERAGQLLLPHTVSLDLFQHSSETLAGLIRFIELSPFELLNSLKSRRLILIGKNTGFRFPDSYLASSDDQRWSWLSDFISSYIERDIPLMGPNISSTTMRRLWSMLAHTNVPASQLFQAR